MSEQDNVDFDVLLALIRKEIDEYDYQALVADRTDLVGVPFPEEKVDAGLASFRAALVSPYWLDIDRRDTYDEMRTEKAVVERCLVVTDDRDGYLLAYQPQTREFLLVDFVGGRHVSIGVRGDPVGCYLAM